jgi:hypothetical protein
MTCHGWTVTVKNPWATPGEGHRGRWLPAGHRSPDGALPGGRPLDDLPAREGDRAAGSVDAQLRDRPPPADARGEDIERGCGIGVDQYLPADGRDSAHGRSFVV